MGDAARPALYLIKNESSVKQGPRPFNGGSAVVFEVEHGKLRQNVIRVNTYEDASTLLAALAMAITQVLYAQQSL